MSEHSDPTVPGQPIRPPRAEGAPEDRTAAGTLVPTADEAQLHPQRSRSRRGLRGIRVGALVAILVGVALVAWLVIRNHNGSSSNSAPKAAASAASVDQLGALAQSVGHPIFWLGPKAGYTYELTQTAGGKVYIRYLPPGVKVGADKPYLTVATYPFPGAFAAIQKQAKGKGALTVNLPAGGLAVLDSSYPKSTHVAYPGVDYQAEVFDPSPAAAMRAVAAGSLSTLGSLKPSSGPAPGKPAAASEASLKSLATTLDHPIYWVGPNAGDTYELTKTSNGNVYIRYLPPGVQVGSPKGYLTVATYPFPDALTALQRQAKTDKKGTIKLPGGGLALIDAQYPKSVHLAFPKSDYQVEVFDPSPALVRQLVKAGKVAAVS